MHTTLNLRPTAESASPARLAPRRHKLLTVADRTALPALYATDGVPLDDKIVHVKFFNPYGQTTWWAVEGEACIPDDGDSDDSDGEEDFMFFGAVLGSELEWGYFSLNELESTGIRMGRHLLPLERDCHWTPKPWREVRAEARL